MEDLVRHTKDFEKVRISRHPSSPTEHTTLSPHPRVPHSPMDKLSDH